MGIREIGWSASKVGNTSAISRTSNTPWSFSSCSGSHSPHFAHPSAQMMAEWSLKIVAFTSLRYIAGIINCLGIRVSAFITGFPTKHSKHVLTFPSRLRQVRAGILSTCSTCASSLSSARWFLLSLPQAELHLHLVLSQLALQERTQL